MKKMLAVLLMLCMMLGAGAMAEAQQHNINEASVEIGDGCGETCPGHVITGSAETTNTISVTGGTHDITLNGVNINVYGDWSCAFSIKSGANVNLTLEGQNRLSSGYDRAGLRVPAGSALVITEKSTGSLKAYGGRYSAGIGGSEDENGGVITIYGGTVNATGGSYGAGIGGGEEGGSGTITIYGGTVTANGGEGGAGIGTGSGGSGGTVTIYGGTVNATGCPDSGHYITDAGIGGAGIGGSGVSVTIHDGTVNASGGKKDWNSAWNGGAGIGGSGASVTISGGTVNATSGEGSSYSYDGAAIGIGGSDDEYSSSVTVKISGGTVNTKGGGEGVHVGKGGTIEISGGTVTTIVEGYDKGGLAGGEGSTITIYDGEVNATGNAYDTRGIAVGVNGTIAIHGGIVKAKGEDEMTGEAGIYAGTGGSIVITGGTVEATGGDSMYSYTGGAGIGGYGASVTISGGSVTATGGSKGPKGGKDGSGVSVASVTISGSERLSIQAEVSDDGNSFTTIGTFTTAGNSVTDKTAGHRFFRTLSAFVPLPAVPAIPDLPETGDPSMLGAWVCLLGAAGVGMKLRRKRG